MMKMAFRPIFSSILTSGKFSSILSKDGFVSAHIFALFVLFPMIKIADEPPACNY